MNRRAPIDVMCIDHVYAVNNPRVCGANGIRLFGDDSHTYLDGEACNGGAVFGYDASISAAAAEHLRVLPAAPSFVETEPRLELAHRIKALFELGTRGRSGRVIFDTSGAGGIETAVKLCANKLDQWRIYTLAGAYHGRSIFTSSLSGSFRYRQTAGVAEFPVTRLPVCREGDPGAARATDLALHYLTDELWGGTATAGYRGRRVRPVLIVETFQNVGGGVLVAADHLRALCDAVHDQGGLVIVDETYTGLFRTGPLWAFTAAGMDPDLIVGCKAFSNGMAPFSAVWADAGVSDIDVAVPGLQSGTFSSCVTNVAVVLAVLDRVDSLGLPALSAMAARIGAELSVVGEQLSRRFDAVCSFAVHGSVLRLDLSFEASVLRERLLTLDGDRLLIAATGLARNTALVTPALIAGTEDVERIGDLLAQGLEASATP